MARIELEAAGADAWREWRELRLAALRDAPYAFGSTLAEWQGEGDTEARWRTRLTAVPYNAICRLDGTACGIASGTEPDDAGDVHLISMWVAPHARGHGCGDALIGAVVAWAEARRAAGVALDVMVSNEHARRLYLRHGFVEDGLSPDGDPARPEIRMKRRLQPAS